MAKRIREKALARKENADKRPRAILKSVRISADKVRIVADLIRNQKYIDAVAILKTTPKASSPILFKLLESAAANAENNLNMSKSELFVAEIYANDGPIMKRIRPRAHGRAFSIHKRTSHITIILDDVANK